MNNLSIFGRKLLNKPDGVFGVFGRQTHFLKNMRHHRKKKASVWKFHTVFCSLFLASPRQYVPNNF